VLDHLHRCLTIWLAPVLCFTAEEAWGARFGEDSSVHLQTFPTLPQAWRDPALAARWDRAREIRRVITGALEGARAEKMIRASLQAKLVVYLDSSTQELLGADDWAELAIVSDVEFSPDAAPEDTFQLTEAPGVAVRVALAGGDQRRSRRFSAAKGESAARLAARRA
jgi:isoleucyl-tRNA synthetase